MRVAVAIMAVLGLALSGCGHAGRSEDAASRRRADFYFARQPGQSRLVERLDRRTSPLAVRVTVPSGVTELWLRSRCTGAAGRISVSVAGVGAGDAPCSRRGAGGGAVALGVDHELRGTRTLTVTAPAGATWSAAVDAQLH